jgi:competence protein ComEC
MRPLPGVVLWYAVGLWLGDQWPVPLPWLFLPAFLLLPLCLRGGWLGAAFLGCLLVLTGWINIVRHNAVLAPHDLRAQLRPEPHLVAIRGRLHTPPTMRGMESDPERSRSFAIVDSTAIRLDHDWMSACGRVWVVTRGQPQPHYVQGREVEVHGVLRPPRGAATVGGFDSRAVLMRRGIHFELNVTSVEDWVLVGEHSPRPSLAAGFGSWARGVLAEGLPCEDDSLRLTWAMVLGWKPGFSDDVAEPFRHSGTMHVFAISGLHIGMIALILVTLTRVLQVPRAACIVIVIPLLWFYAAVTGWQSSAVRATVMMSIVVAGWSLKRPTDLLNSLAGAAIVILLWEPHQLFQAGFQLSFSVVLSIGLLLPPLSRVRDRLLRHDPLLPDDLRPPWQRRMKGSCRHGLTSLAISIAAWLGSIPWMAWYFQIFTPVTLVANLFMVPLAAGVLASSLASLAVGAWFPMLSGVFNHSAWLWMSLMTRTSEVAAALPGAWFEVPAPPVYALALYYPLLAGIATGWLLRPRRLLLAGLLLLTVGGVFLTQQNRQRQEVRLMVLALRGGDSVFFEALGQYEPMLIDTGDAMAAEFTVLPFLRTRGISHLPNLLLTHGDVRHMGGAVWLLNEVKVDRVITSALGFRSSYYRDLVRHLETTPDQWLRVGRGDRVGPWEVLHPAKEDRFSRADDGAIVLGGTFHGTRLLLCSDLGRLGQRSLAERERDLQADLVIAGMPGPDEPLGNLFLEGIQPALIILSTGEYPASERPSRELRARLEAWGRPVLFTGDHGTVIVTLRSSGWQVRTLDGPCHSGQPRRVGTTDADFGVARGAHGN